MPLHGGGLADLALGGGAGQMEGRLGGGALSGSLARTTSLSFSFSYNVPVLLAETGMPSNWWRMMSLVPSIMAKVILTGVTSLISCGCLNIIKIYWLANLV